MVWAAYKRQVLWKKNFRRWVAVEFCLSCLLELHDLVLCQLQMLTNDSLEALHGFVSGEMWVERVYVVVR